MVKTPLDNFKQQRKKDDKIVDLALYPTQKKIDTEARQSSH
jgi:hypothetical protein